MIASGDFFSLNAFTIGLSYGFGGGSGNSDDSPSSK
jgi:hypothetical protein